MKDLYWLHRHVNDYARFVMGKADEPISEPDPLIIHQIVLSAIAPIHRPIDAIAEDTIIGWTSGLFFEHEAGRRSYCITLKEFIPTPESPMDTDRHSNFIVEVERRREMERRRRQLAEFDELFNRSV